MVPTLDVHLITFLLHICPALIISERGSYLLFSASCLSHCRVPFVDSHFGKNSNGRVSLVLASLASINILLVRVDILLDNAISYLFLINNANQTEH